MERMTIIVGSRGSGKTSELIKISNQTGHPILVKDHKRKKYVEQVAIKIGYPILPPIVWGVVPDGRYYGSNIAKVLVDDADELIEMYVQDLFGNHETQVAAVALSGIKREPVKEPWFERVLRKVGLTK